MGLVATAVATFALAFATAAIAATGDLAQKSGTEGCISEDGTSGTCADGIGLDGASSVAISPDGKNAYATGGDGNSVAVFDRNTATGALTQKSGTDGCISESGSGGACADGKALGGASSVAVSPDGKSVYVASTSAFAVAVFDRNTATGALTQKSGTDGCISENGSSGFPNNTPGACVDGVALNGPKSIAISADGKNAYAASGFSDAIVIFDRNTTTGALTQKAGTAGCLSETGTGGACTIGLRTDGVQSIAVSPDDKSVYAAANLSDAVVVLDRNASTGALTQKAGTDGCVSQTGSGGQCADGTALDGASAVTVSPDDKNVYATSYFSDAVTVFDRDSSGKLTQKAGTDGCISQDGTGGECVDGTALNAAFSIAITPDGENVYATARPPSNSITVFERDPSSGTLAQREGKAGCITETGMGGACGNGNALVDPRSVTVSPDDNNVYAAAVGSDAVTIFDRDDGVIDAKVSAQKTQKQKGKKIVVKVQVKPKESLDAEASGKVKIKKKKIKLDDVAKSVAKDESATLKLVPAKSNGGKKIAKALKKSKGKANIDVTLTDSFGNTSKAKLTVTLKAK